MADMQVNAHDQTVPCELFTAAPCWRGSFLFESLLVIPVSCQSRACWQPASRRSAAAYKLCLCCEPLVQLSVFLEPLSRLRQHLHKRRDMAVHASNVDGVFVKLSMPVCVPQCS
jgi:hypothetical protein